MPAVVIDASATLAWLFGENDPKDWLTAQASSAALLAPAHWRLEVVNAVIVKERRRQITRVQGDRFLQILDALPIATVQSRPEQTLSQLADLARDHPLTAYDAVYLDLALTASASLATLDNNLKDAAGRMNVGLIKV
jgi:predicted nucleic acid-binding protein